MELSEQEFLEIYKSIIEEEYFTRESGKQLKQRDFEYLIDLIEEKSGTRLSISTLKRLWRKTSKQNPHPSTLNALVSILSYKDWHDFKLKNTPISSTEIQPALINNSQSNNFWKTKSWVVIVIVLIILITTIITYSFISLKDKPSIDTEKIELNVSNTVETGVPNTIIFNYNLTNISADKFFLQQDWNPENKVEISPENNFYSTVYYYPGFHTAKLYADQTLLKTEDVFIKTDGWLTLVNLNQNENIPINLSSKITNEHTLTIQEESLETHGLKPMDFEGTIFFNIRDFGKLDAHNFTAETRFKNHPFTNTQCDISQFTIHTEGNIYYLQFTSLGCVGDLRLKLGEKLFLGTENNLTAFGTNTSEWQDIKLVIRDKFAQVFFGNDEIYSTLFEEDFGHVVGVDFRFSGIGEIDYMNFKDVTNNLVYESNF